MLQYFKGSFLVTIIGFIAAYFWGAHLHESGWAALLAAVFLAVLEVTFSFDNAVINAVKLEKLTDKWRHRFITWGILIAVFGMRLLFPVLIVSIFAELSLFEAANLAFNDVTEYTRHLHHAHAPLVSFGGAFLFMIFFSYFFCPEKECHWIKCVERPIQKLSCIKYIEVICVLFLLILLQHYLPEEQKLPVVIAGLSGIISYILVDGVSSFIEGIEARKTSAAGTAGKLGFIGFLYLELIDASFSLDGVLGSFAITKDIVIICIGLAIGAMFVRSLTIYIAEKKTLKRFIYLEHGAHWAIGVLALVMFISTIQEVPEAVTGSIGILFVSLAFISSIIHNKKKLAAENNAEEQ